MSYSFFNFIDGVYFFKANPDMKKNWLSENLEKYILFNSVWQKKVERNFKVAESSSLICANICLSMADKIVQH